MLSNVCFCKVDNFGSAVELEEGSASSNKANISAFPQSLLHSFAQRFKLVFFISLGGPDNQVHFEGYQVSNQCMALVGDDCFVPCRDAPELGYVKESSSEQYVPDVFYKVPNQLFVLLCIIKYMVNTLAIIV